MMILTTSMSTMFSMLKHPLAMGASLLVQTTLITMMSGMLMKTFWFAYILFIIFVGGMLVLFIYVTTLASNEMFKFSTKMLVILTITMTMNWVMWNYWDKEMVYSWAENKINNPDIYSNETNKMLMKLYNKPTMIITITMAIYMLLTLIVVVKITSINSGPLRSTS
uniref:NADH-ubiquinone oxidoreductase chain 6 n=1 Tax=Anaplecta calosoma TaxID=1554546 RepID=A0A2P1H9B3_9NEOP|nr:NADH dehydrogenase subunit 6 [Anaplecta calosoma]